MLQLDLLHPTPSGGASNTCQHVVLDLATTLWWRPGLRHLHDIQIRLSLAGEDDVVVEQNAGNSETFRFSAQYSSPTLPFVPMIMSNNCKSEATFPVDQSHWFGLRRDDAVVHNRGKACLSKHIDGMCGTRPNGVNACRRVAIRVKQPQVNLLSDREANKQLIARYGEGIWMKLLCHLQEVSAAVRAPSVYTEEEKEKEHGEELQLVDATYCVVDAATQTYS